MNYAELDLQHTITQYQAAVKALDLAPLELPTIKPAPGTMTAGEAYARAVDLFAKGEDPGADAALKKYAAEASMRDNIRLSAAWEEATARTQLEAVASHAAAHLPDLKQRFDAAAHALEDAAANPGTLAATDPATLTVLDRSEAGMLARNLAPHLDLVELVSAYAPALLDGAGKVVRSLVDPMPNVQWATVRPVAEHVGTLDHRGKAPRVTGNAVWDAALCPGVRLDLATSHADLAQRQADYEQARSDREVRAAIAADERRYGAREARQEEGQAMLRAWDAHMGGN